MNLLAGAVYYIFAVIFLIYLVISAGMVFFAETRWQKFSALLAGLLLIPINWQFVWEITGLVPRPPTETLWIWGLFMAVGGLFLFRHILPDEHKKVCD